MLVVLLTSSASSAGVHKAEVEGTSRSHQCACQLRWETRSRHTWRPQLSSSLHTRHTIATIMRVPRTGINFHSRSTVDHDVWRDREPRDVSVNPGVLALSIPSRFWIKYYSLVSISLPPSSAWLEDSQLNHRCTSTYTNARRPSLKRGRPRLL